MGSNRYGQLGLGHCRDASAPCPVDALASCSAVACGASFSLAICRDGVLQSCGNNEHMQLGRQVLSAPLDRHKGGAAAAFDCNFHPLSIALGPGGSWSSVAGQEQEQGGSVHPREVQPPQVQQRLATSSVAITRLSLACSAFAPLLIALQAYLVAAGWSHGLAAVRFRYRIHFIFVFTRCVLLC